MPNPITQSSFIGGELSLALAGRTDLQRYTQAAEIIENFVVDPQGGVSNRQGSEYIAETKLQDGSQVRLISFEPSADDSYILEFGHEYLRIFTPYGPVLDMLDPEVVSVPAVALNVLYLLQPASFGGDGNIYIAQSFTVPGTVADLTITSVWFEIDKFVVTPPVIEVAIYTDNAGEPGTAVPGLDFGDFLPVDPAVFTEGSVAEQNGVPLKGHLTPFYLAAATSPTFTVGTILHIVVRCATPPGSGGARPVIPVTDTDVYAGGHLSYMTDAGAWAPQATHDAMFRVYGTAPGGPLEFVTPYQSAPMDDLGTESELMQLVTTQSVDVMTICHKNYTPYELKRYGENSWTFEAVVVETSYGAPEKIEFTPDPPGHIPSTAPTKLWEYAVAGVSRDGIESAPLLTGELNVGVMSDTDYLQMIITGVIPVDHYVVYKGRNGTYGFIGVTKMRPDLTEAWDRIYAQKRLERYAYWRTQKLISVGALSGPVRKSDYRRDDKTIVDLADAEARAFADQAVLGLTGGVVTYQFSDENFAPDYTDQPRRFINPFSAEGGQKPACVSYFQQRLVFANWLGHGDTVAMSEVADFHNFQRNIPTIDDDPIEATLAQGSLNDIKALVALRALFIFTSGGEYIMSTEKGPVTPSNIDSIPVSRRGSGTLQPLVIGNVILFKDRGGHIREWLFDQNTQDYPSTDVGLLASHLFDKYLITSWGYASSPRSVVWATRADGTLLSFTYVREQNVAAWTRHVTDGKYRHVCTSREIQQPGETVHVVVVRNINGVEKTFYEKLPPRDPDLSAFLDCYAEANGETSGSLSLDIVPSPGAPGSIVAGVLVGTMGWLKGNWVHAVSTGVTMLNADIGAAGVAFRTSDGSTLMGRVVLLDAPGAASSTSYWIELDQDVPSTLTGSPPVIFTDWNKTQKRWTGWSHLIGETVSVVADGNVHPSVVVAGDGSITIDAFVSQVFAGLPYESTVKTLSITAGQNEIRSKVKIIPSVDLDVKDTRGLWLGEKETSLTQVKPEYPQTGRLVTARVTGRCATTWNKSGTLFIKQRDPLPCTILSMTPEVTLGG